MNLLCYIFSIPEELVMDLDLEELTLVELLEVETALVGFMLSALLLRCCHIIVEVCACMYVFGMFCIDKYRIYLVKCRDVYHLNSKNWAVTIWGVAFNLVNRKAFNFVYNLISKEPRVDTYTSKNITVKWLLY